LQMTQRLTFHYFPATILLLIYLLNIIALLLLMNLQSFGEKWRTKLRFINVEWWLSLLQALGTHYLNLVLFQFRVILKYVSETLVNFIHLSFIFIIENGVENEIFGFKKHLIKLSPPRFEDFHKTQVSVNNLILIELVYRHRERLTEIFYIGESPTYSRVEKGLDSHILGTEYLHKQLIDLMSIRIQTRKKLARWVLLTRFEKRIESTLE
jgi:hypothetical protein